MQCIAFLKVLSPLSNRGVIELKDIECVSGSLVNETLPGSFHVGTVDDTSTQHFHSHWVGVVGLVKREKTSQVSLKSQTRPKRVEVCSNGGEPSTSPG